MGDKAKIFGHKSKSGYVTFRVKIQRCNRIKPVDKGIVNAKPISQGVTQLKPTCNLCVIAEGRVSNMCGNLRVFNSYWVNQDSIHKYYEVILVDPSHKIVCSDLRINWICNLSKKHRQLRGLTRVGLCARGLTDKGH